VVFTERPIVFNSPECWNTFPYGQNTLNLYASCEAQMVCCFLRPTHVQKIREDEFTFMSHVFIIFHGELPLRVAREIAAVSVVGRFNIKGIVAIIADVILN